MIINYKITCILIFLLIIILLLIIKNKELFVNEGIFNTDQFEKRQGKGKTDIKWTNNISVLDDCCGGKFVDHMDRSCEDNYKVDNENNADITCNNAYYACPNNAEVEVMDGGQTKCRANPLFVSGTPSSNKIKTGVFDENTFNQRKRKGKKNEKWKKNISVLDDCCGGEYVDHMGRSCKNNYKVDDESDADITCNNAYYACPNNAEVEVMDGEQTKCRADPLFPKTQITFSEATFDTKYAVFNRAVIKALSKKTPKKPFSPVIIKVPCWLSKRWMDYRSLDKSIKFAFIISNHVGPGWHIFGYIGNNISENMNYLSSDAVKEDWVYILSMNNFKKGDLGKAQIRWEPQAPDVKITSKFTCYCGNPGGDTCEGDVTEYHTENKIVFYYHIEGQYDALQKFSKIIKCKVTETQLNTIKQNIDDYVNPTDAEANWTDSCVNPTPMYVRQITFMVISQDKENKTTGKMETITDGGDFTNQILLTDYVPDLFINTQGNIEDREHEKSKFDFSLQTLFIGPYFKYSKIRNYNLWLGIAKNNNSLVSQFYYTKDPFTVVDIDSDDPCSKIEWGEGITYTKKLKYPWKQLKFTELGAVPNEKTVEYVLRGLDEDKAIKIWGSSLGGAPKGDDCKYLNAKLDGLRTAPNPIKKGRHCAIYSAENYTYIFLTRNFIPIYKSLDKLKTFWPYECIEIIRLDTENIISNKGTDDEKIDFSSLDYLDIEKNIYPFIRGVENYNTFSDDIKSNGWGGPVDPSVEQYEEGNPNKIIIAYTIRGQEGLDVFRPEDSNNYAIIEDINVAYNNAVNGNVIKSNVIYKGD